MSTRAIARNRLRRWALLAAFAFGCAPQRGTIGALLVQSPEGRLTVHEVPKGLGAEKAGVAPGDEVLLIDGRAADAMTPGEVHRALSGEVGEPVKLTLVRGERIVRVSVRRTPAKKSGPEPAGGDKER